MDYGHDLLFGTFLTPDAADPARVVGLAQLTDAVGLDLVTVQDHPYNPVFLDTWTLLATLAGTTQNVRLAPNVLNLPLRPPAVLARAAASLDLLSNGRLELGLGAGAFWDPIVAMGGPRRSPAEAVAALEEAIAVLRGLWDTGSRSLRHDGEHYRVHGARTGPAPAHRIGIHLGAYKPRMLELTGRLADGWWPSMGYLDPPGLAEANARIDEAAVAAGRSPADVRRLYNVRLPSGRLQDWVEELAGLAVEEGISAFVVGSDDPDTITMFGEEVAPAVRELVGRERGGQATDVAATTTSTPAPTHALWDETSRPTGPAPEPDATYSAQQRASGQHLVDVHDHLRAELTQVEQLVVQVLRGATGPGAARSEINAMTMRQNDWTLGAYCASYCRVVTTHHTIEDQHMFPALRRGDPRLAPVVDRLEAEHRVIHDVLERVDRALVTYVHDSDGGTALREAMSLLAGTLLSHLAYEERELVEPLSRLGLLV